MSGVPPPPRLKMPPPIKLVPPKPKTPPPPPNYSPPPPPLNPNDAPPLDEKTIEVATGLSLGKEAPSSVERWTEEEVFTPGNDYYLEPVTPEYWTPEHWTPEHWTQDTTWDKELQPQELDSKELKELEPVELESAEILSTDNKVDFLIFARKYAEAVVEGKMPPISREGLDKWTNPKMQPRPYKNPLNLIEFDRPKDGEVRAKAMDMEDKLVALFTFAEAEWEKLLNKGPLAQEFKAELVFDDDRVQAKLKQVMDVEMTIKAEESANAQETVAVEKPVEVEKTVQGNVASNVEETESVVDEPSYLEVTKTKEVEKGKDALSPLEIILGHYEKYVAAWSQAAANNQPAPADKPNFSAWPEGGLPVKGELVLIEVEATATKVLIEAHTATSKKIVGGGWIDKGRWEEVQIPGFMGRYTQNISAYVEVDAKEYPVVFEKVKNVELKLPIGRKLTFENEKMTREEYFDKTIEMVSGDTLVGYPDLPGSLFEEPLEIGKAVNIVLKKHYPQEGWLALVKDPHDGDKPMLAMWIAADTQKGAAEVKGKIGTGDNTIDVTLTQVANWLEEPFLENKQPNDGSKGPKNDSSEKSKTDKSSKTNGTGNSQPKPDTSSGSWKRVAVLVAGIALLAWFARQRKTAMPQVQPPPALPPVLPPPVIKA